MVKRTIQLVDMNKSAFAKYEIRRDIEEQHDRCIHILCNVVVITGKYFIK